MKYGIHILIPCLLALAACTTDPSEPKGPDPTTPGPPENVVAIVDDSILTVTWTAPESDGGSEITGYRIMYMSVDNYNQCEVPSTVFTCTISGVANDVSVSIDAVSLNSIGQSLWVTVKAVKPAEGPDAPDSLLLTTANGQVTASWIAPKNSSLPTTGYTVTASPGFQTCTTSGTSCTVSGLANGSTYSFTVTATNDSGTSPASAPASTVPMQWTVQSSGTTRILNEVVWTGSQLITVGDSGTILSSSNGLNWSSRVSGTNRRLNSLVWANSQLVVVGDSGSVLTSSDGIVWVVRNSGTTAKLNAVTGSPSGFVAVGAKGAVLTSADGITWTSQVPLTQTEFRSVTYSEGQFITTSVGGITASDGGSSEGGIWTSFTGIEWQKRYEPGSTPTSVSELNSILWSGSQWVAVGIRYQIEQVSCYPSSHCYPTAVSYARILTSPDGISWTDRSRLISPGRGQYIEPNSVASSVNRYVGVSGKQSYPVGAGYGVDGAGFISLDGISWMRLEIPQGSQLNSVVWAGTQWVTVGLNGRILTSPH